MELNNATETRTIDMHTDSYMIVVVGVFFIVRYMMNNKKYDNGNTTYFNKGKNHWVAQYSVSIEGERFRPTRTGTTEEEALGRLETAKRSFFKQKKLRKKPLIAKVTVGNVADLLLRFLDNSVEQSTFQEYCYRGRLLKESNIGNKNIKGLDKVTIQEAINEIANKHTLSESVCFKVMQFTKRVFAYAHEEKIIEENPIGKKNSLRLPIVATASKDVKPLSSESKDLILGVLESSPRFKPIIYLMLYAGLRLGETLALSWEKIDFKKNEITINTSVKKHKCQEAGEAKTIFKIGRTKTKGSVRTVPMSEDLHNCLLVWKNVQPFIAKDETGLNLCFPKPNGKILSYDAFQESFSNFLQGLDIDHTIYHSRAFRHTYASYLVKAGVHVKTLQSLLGHTNIETTLKYYVNTDIEAMQETARLVDYVMSNESDFKFGDAV